MGTVYQQLTPEAAAFPAATFPQFNKVAGTSFPVTGLAYDAATDEAAFWKVEAIAYGSGNVTCDIAWYADSASSGDVVWGVSLAAITPDTDSGDVETKALAAENTVTDTHLGTTGQRLHRASVTVSNLDSLANRDDVWVRVRRVGSSGSDTMTGDAILVLGVLSYSDT